MSTRPNLISREVEINARANDLLAKFDLVLDRPVVVAELAETCVKVFQPGADMRSERGLQPQSSRPSVSRASFGHPAARNVAIDVTWVRRSLAVALSYSGGCKAARSIDQKTSIK